MMTLGLFGCQGTGKKAETESDSTGKVSVKTVSVDDMEMDYVVFGSGKKTFVILPGLSVHSVTGSAETIAAAFESFAEDYTVYLFDRAEKLDNGCTIQDMAKDTASAMKALGIENADVFGASQGGMIAMCLAIDYPELVHKMVLGSTISKPNDTFTEVCSEWIELAGNRDEDGLIESFIEKVYSKATVEAYRDTLIASNKGITDDEYTRFLIQAKACRNFDCYDELSDIQCEVLVIGSEGDNVTTAEASIQISDAIGCNIYLYDNSYGHGVYDEAPDYRQRCLDFFSK